MHQEFYGVVRFEIQIIFFWFKSFCYTEITHKILNLNPIVTVKFGLDYNPNEKLIFPMIFGEPT